MKKIIRKSANCLFFSLWLLGLMACQSQTPVKNTTSAERPLKVIRSQDGIQNIQWKITQISSKPAKFFHQQPTLQLNSNIKRLQGNTGCNLLFGEYQLNTQNQSLDIMAKASHESCDGALAQEAELMDALIAVKRYQLEGQRLRLLNDKGQTLISLTR